MLCLGAQTHLSEILLKGKQATVIFLLIEVPQKCVSKNVQLNLKVLGGCITTQDFDALP